MLCSWLALPASKDISLVQPDEVTTDFHKDDTGLRARLTQWPDPGRRFEWLSHLEFWYPDSRLQVPLPTCRLPAAIVCRLQPALPCAGVRR